MSNYKSKEFNKLKLEWYKKLKEDGFQDIEYKQMLRAGINWNQYKTPENFHLVSEKKAYRLWVLEINAYNNPTIEFKVRRLLQRYLDTLGHKEQHKKFLSTLPNRFFLYNYIRQHKQELDDFAREFHDRENS